MSVEALISVLVGVVATWLFAHVYYWRAGKELHTEAEKLRRETYEVRALVNELAFALNRAGAIHANFDEKTGDLIEYIRILPKKPHATHLAENRAMDAAETNSIVEIEHEL